MQTSLREMYNKGFTLIVCDINGGNTQLLLDAPEFKLHLLPQFFIKGGQGLIKEQ